MSLTTDEMLFYGGICLAAIDLLLLIIYKWGAGISRRHIEEKMRLEYGED